MSDQAHTPIPDGPSTIPWNRLSPHQSTLLLVIGRRACDAMQSLIADRRLREHDSTRLVDPDPLLIAMDVGAVYLARDGRIDLESLARYPDDQLLRDVLAMQQHLNRTTGAFPFTVALRCAMPAHILRR